MRHAATRSRCGLRTQPQAQQLSGAKENEDVESKQHLHTSGVAGVLGALLGIVAGGYLGVISGFGSWMIATFNPGLPEMDFRDSFGFIGGVFIGSVVGAIGMAALVSLVQWNRAGKEARK